MGKGGFLNHSVERHLLMLFERQSVLHFFNFKFAFLLCLRTSGGASRFHNRSVESGRYHYNGHFTGVANIGQRDSDLPKFHKCSWNSSSDWHKFHTFPTRLMVRQGRRVSRSAPCQRLTRMFADRSFHKEGSDGGLLWHVCVVDECVCGEAGLEGKVTMAPR